MCGICCVIANSSCEFNEKLSQPGTQDPLVRRGPDHHAHASVSVCPGVGLELHGHVLHHRGRLTPQPLADADGNRLLWNAEVFGGLQVPEGANDGAWVLAQLQRRPVLDVLPRVRGPWAAVYWQASSRSLWFGRDFFGRRSLLWHLSSDASDPFVLSSVAISSLEWQEIPAYGIYRVQFPDTPEAGISIELFPWDYLWKEETRDSCREVLTPMATARCSLQIWDEQQIPAPIAPFNMTVRSKTSEKTAADESEPRLAVANTSFVSNGEYAATQSDRTRSDLPARDVIKPEHDELIDSQKYESSAKSRDGAVHATPDSSDTVADSDINVLRHCDETTLLAAQQFIDVLSRAVAKRVANCASLCRDCITSEGSEPEDWASASSREEGGAGGEKSCGHCRVAVLFSGGVDSTTLARLAHRHVPVGEPIDLLNVAFNKPRRVSHTVAKSKKKKEVLAAASAGAGDDPYNVPDRQTGLSALRELRATCPGRHWRFVHVDVTLDELKHWRQERISQLVYPLRTVLDDSIGCAVWFAARGCGWISSQGGDTLYTSPARVVLVGMGADEQLCGYSRHRMLYQQTGSYDAVAKEIEMEIRRISARNLGRDDRIISDHGRESRYPFLDEDVVSFLNSLPINTKADLSLGRGEGEKLIIRAAAALLGLPHTAARPKRAIQFGSRIAKAEGTNRERADHVCQRL